MPERILITGGAGFIWHHTVKAIQEDYPHAKLQIIDDCSRTLTRNKKSVQWILGEKDTFHKIDIASKKARTVIATFAPDLIIHLAAQISIVQSFWDPQRTHHSNIAGTQNIIDALQDAQYRESHLIFASSGWSVYGDTHVIPTPEYTGTSPKSPYAYSKVAGEILLKMYHELWCFWALTVLRLSNVYGPGQNTADSASVIQTALDKIKQWQPFSLIGNPENTRDYVYVSDVVDAIRKSQKQRISGTFNIGTGEETSVLDVLRVCEEIAWKTLQKDTTRQTEWTDLLARSCLDIKKSRTRLWWKPTVELQNGITEVWKQLNS